VPEAFNWVFGSVYTSYPNDHEIHLLLNFRFQQ